MPAHLARLLPFLLLGAFAAPALAEEEEPPICDQGTSSITKAACDARLQKYQPILAEGAPMVDIKARCPKISGLSYDMRCVDPPIPRRALTREGRHRREHRGTDRHLE